jgi:hypothetical protein
MTRKRAIRAPQADAPRATGPAFTRSAATVASRGDPGARYQKIVVMSLKCARPFVESGRDTTNL